MKHALAILVGLLVVCVFALILTSCGPMLYGHSYAPAKPSHLLLTIYNSDPGYNPGDPAAMTITCWTASSVTSSSDFSVPALGARTLDLGTVKPDGLQLVGSAFAFSGIPNGPGGLVLSGPELGNDSEWIIGVLYPSGVVSVRR